MIILFLLFLVQFAVACACLALTPSQQATMVSEGWKKAAFPFKGHVQVMFECCSLNDTDVAPSNDTFGYPSCSQVNGPTHGHGVVLNFWVYCIRIKYVIFLRNPFLGYGPAFKNVSLDRNNGTFNHRNTDVVRMFIFWWLLYNIRKNFF